MSDIPKFEDWSRRRQVLDDENEHLIPLRPLATEDRSERIIGWAAVAAIFWLIVIGIWAHFR